LCQGVEVADQEGEEADVEGLADEPGDDVLVGCDRPEQAGERDVDRDQRGREKRDLGAEQSEAGIDVGGEDLQEAIDDPRAPHFQCPLRSVPGVLTSDCGVDGARSRWILGAAGGTSGVAGNNWIERSWCGAEGARKRARFCTQTVLQAASWAASAPRALQRASSLASGSMLSCAAGSDDSRVRPCQTNSSAHASTAPPSRMTAAALAMIFGSMIPCARQWNICTV